MGVTYSADPPARISQEDLDRALFAMMGETLRGWQAELEAMKHPAEWAAYQDSLKAAEHD